MGRYTVSPPITGFSCDVGGAAPDENGIFTIDNAAIVSAMVNHGLTVTEVVEPEAPAKPLTAAEKKAAAKAEADAKAAQEAAAAAAEAAKTEAEQLDAALKAALDSVPGA